MKKNLFFLLIALAFPRLIWAENDLFSKANQSYQDEKYAEAIRLYNEALEESTPTAAIYFNLGNAHFRTNETGKAILNYRRALMLAPGNNDILYNLSVAKERLQDDFEEIPPFFLVSWWRNARDLFSSVGWSLSALAFLWLGLGLIIFPWFRKLNRRGLSYAFGAIVLLMSILSFSLALSRYQYETDSKTVVVLARETDLKSAPEEDAASLTKIHEGLTVSVEDKIGNWWKVTLPNGEQGWLAMIDGEKV